MLGEGNSQVSVDEMVVKLTKPLRGEWHEDWGSWEKRPWDALTISHEEVDGIDVYVQEAAQTDIAPEHEELFLKALKAHNKAHTADGDDRYILWDGDDRGGPVNNSVIPASRRDPISMLGRYGSKLMVNPEESSSWIIGQSNLTAKTAKPSSNRLSGNGLSNRLLHRALCAGPHAMLASTVGRNGE